MSSSAARLSEEYEWHQRQRSVRLSVAELATIRAQADGFRVDMAPEPRAVKLLTALAKRHSDSLGADHRRILEAIEDHANPAASLTAWPRIAVPLLH